MRDLLKPTQADQDFFDHLNKNHSNSYDRIASALVTLKELGVFEYLREKHRTRALPEFDPDMAAALAHHATGAHDAIYAVENMLRIVFDGVKSTRVKYTPRDADFGAMGQLRNAGFGENEINKLLK